VISFNMPARLGRLGNQMYQYATLLGVAGRKGYGLSIPADGHGLAEAFPAVRRRPTGANQDAPQIRERHFHFDPEVAYACPDGADLVGYFQSERYFADAAEAVRSEFAFEDGIASACRRVVEGLGPETISLHVRRTDYVALSEIHPPCDLDYYEAALARLEPDAPVMVFSDDLDWCRAQALFQGGRFSFSEGRSAAEDLCLMSLCRRHVIANSSFSWWGAWLNPDPQKLVIAPARWFGTTGYTSQHDTSDLIPESWARI
jgi:hypothetical protein